MNPAEGTHLRHKTVQVNRDKLSQGVKRLLDIARRDGHITADEAAAIRDHIADQARSGSISAEDRQLELAFLADRSPDVEVTIELLMADEVQGEVRQLLSVDTDVQLNL